MPAKISSHPQAPELAIDKTKWLSSDTQGYSASKVVFLT